jgi:hypothetical protein
MALLGLPPPEAVAIQPKRGKITDTVNVAFEDVTLPRLLLTTTVNTLPLSPLIVFGVVYDALTAPAISTPFFFH